MLTPINPSFSQREGCDEKTMDADSFCAIVAFFMEMSAENAAAPSPPRTIIPVIIIGMIFFIVSLYFLIPGAIHIQDIYK